MREDAIDAQKFEQVLPSQHGNPAVQSGGEAVNSPLPRPERRRRRSKSERGLPEDRELENLAKAFLEAQREYWPDLTSLGIFPEPSQPTVSAMVENFKNRHMGVEPPEVPESLRGAIKRQLAGGYLRYSCDNSDPTSIVDQMVNVLAAANRENRLLIWDYLFADYAVSGLDANRQGYSAYRRLLESKQPLESTYIDDFTRASRDSLEWWRLAEYSKRYHKRLVGASDGFDLSSADWDIKVTVYGLISRLFVKSLREKVLRGMKGAARRFGTLGKLALGFTRRPKLDENGRPLIKANGRPMTEPCIDEETRDARLLMYRMFVEEGQSPGQIAKRFNELEIDNAKCWDRRTIVGLLKSPTAIGVFISNRQRTEFDPVENRWISVKKPRSEWVVQFRRELAIVPMALWCAARKKLAHIRANDPKTGKRRTRNEVRPTTLFSGTLFCDYCNEELKLIRSTEKYKQFGCINGPQGAHNCKLTTSKTSRQIEEVLLRVLRDDIFTDERLDEVVEMANDYISKLQGEPTVETAPLKREIQKKQTSVSKLLSMIESEDDSATCQTYHQRIKSIQRDMESLQREVRDAEVKKVATPVPLTKEKAKEYRDRLTVILNAAGPNAALAIRELTGPIRVKQMQEEGQTRGAKWIASFEPNYLAGLRIGANGDRLPDVPAPATSRIEVVIDLTPAYQKIAPKLKEYLARGVPLQAATLALGISYQVGLQAKEFIETGKAVKPKPRKSSGNAKRTGEPRSKPKYQVIAKEVTSAFEGGETIRDLATKFHTSESTIYRAIGISRPEAVKEAVANGSRIRHAREKHPHDFRHDEVRKLLKRGLTIKEVANQAKCGESTVRRVLAKLDDEGLRKKCS